MRRPMVLAALAPAVALVTAACGGDDTDVELPKAGATTGASAPQSLEVGEIQSVVTEVD